MKFFLSCFFTVCMTFVQAQDKKMCISVDDLPVVSYGIEDPDFGEKITEKLLSTFRKHEVPAIGYVNEHKLYKNGTLDQSMVHLLELWLKNGNELGNHTYSHMNYHSSAFGDYTEDIIRGEKITRQLTDEYKTPLKYFRHPYLRSGMNKEHADTLENFLNQVGYTTAPVSIDNDDYLFAKAYHDAFMAGDSTLMEKIGQAYLSYMEDKLLYFERSSINLFNRNISHILLVHASLLNAEYLDDLIEVYNKHGYQYISQGEALEDEVYREKITRFGDWGISWIDRCALSQGKKGDFFKDEPFVPEFIRDLNQDNTY
ncbi:MAG: polysaccharide deacetylase family protein [Cyclobacteriaceae bacterium]|nr:polysaccharide deacetylase family protein [Cyclobacteriaceae bacterium]